MEGSDVSSNGAATSVQARRGTKQKRVETAAQTGYYADPMSPIASTPLKRPRTKPVNSKSVKAKHAPGSAARPSVTTEIGSPDEQFFSPRKLDKEFGPEDADGNGKQRKQEVSSEPSRTSPSPSPEASPTSSHKSEVDEAMFSPSLKPPHPHGKTETTTVSTTTVTTKETVEEDSVHHEETHSSTEVSETDSSNEYAEAEFNPFVFIKSLPPYEDMAPDGRVTVLPSRTKHTPNICLVLDLDETLVHCTVEQIDNPHLQFPVNFNGVDYTVNVKKRPHMDHFLKRAAHLFEVVVFTASHRAYAEQLLNRLDPRRELIKFRLYREDCLEVYGNYLKDLNVLGRDLSKVVLVDNSPHAFGYQVNNGIPIETWYEGENDDELLKLLPFLESLVDVDDVRPIVEKQFQIQKLIDAVPDDGI